MNRYSQIMAFIDAAKPECRARREFALAWHTKGPEHAYAFWKARFNITDRKWLDLLDPMIEEAQRAFRQGS